MLSLEQLRKIQPELKNLSDKELIKIREKYYGLGKLAYDNWPNRVSGVSKNPVGLVTALSGSVRI